MLININMDQLSGSSGYNTPAVAKPNSSALSNFEETKPKERPLAPENAVVRLDMTNSIEFPTGSTLDNLRSPVK